MSTTKTPAPKGLVHFGMPESTSRCGNLFIGEGGVRGTMDLDAVTCPKCERWAPIDHSSNGKRRRELSEAARVVLIRRYRAGDKLAGARVITSMGTQLHNMAFRHGLVSDMDDLVQVGRIAVAKCIEPGSWDEARGPFFAYVAMAVWGAMLRYGKRSRRRWARFQQAPDVEVEGELCAPAELVEDPREGTEDAFEKHEELALIRDLLPTLPAVDQRVIKMRLDNMTLEDVGAVFGVSRERARQIEQRAARALRERVSVAGIRSRTARRADG